MWDYGFGHMGFFSFGWMLIFWIALIWFFIWIANKAKEPVKSPTNSLEILKERYAKGEINKKEFHDIKKELIH